MIYDVIVIGAGVTGAFIARELSRYDVRVCLAEKGADVAVGTSKANSGIIHSGCDAKSGTLKAKLNVRGNYRMERIAAELNVPFKRTGSLVLCTDHRELDKLHELRANGLKNGVYGLEILSGDQLHNMEPNISKKAVSALYAPSAGIICPYELTLGAAENAVENGADIKLECEVNSVDFENGRFILHTSAGSLESRYLVNAAGLFSDRIAQMAGDSSFTINPRKGEYLLFDKKAGNRVNKVIFQLPSEKGKGVLAAPTVDGNLIIGPNAEEIHEKDDLSTSGEGMKEIIEKAWLSVPDLDMKEVITSFAGLRAGTAHNDFIISASQVNNKLIHAAGIESPGLTAAPAIAEMVAGLLAENGLTLSEKAGYNPVRRPVVRLRELDPTSLAEVMKEDPLYGRIVCRCEKVSEGEVVRCIHSTIGARNTDAVKRRTRAGMGRCQGGFCLPRIVGILSRELGIPMEEVTKNGGESRILAGRTK